MCLFNDVKKIGTKKIDRIQIDIHKNFFLDLFNIKIPEYNNKTSGYKNTNCFLNKRSIITKKVLQQRFFMLKLNINFEIKRNEKKERA